MSPRRSGFAGICCASGVGARVCGTVCRFCRERCESLFGIISDGVTAAPDAVVGWGVFGVAEAGVVGISAPGVGLAGARRGWAGVGAEVEVW